MNQIYLEILRLFKEREIPLKATQKEICVPIVERIYKKMKAGIKFSGIHICEDMIINGHHRYIASLLSGFSIEKNSWGKARSTKIIEWSDVKLVKDDWDTEAKLLKFNKEDAEYNNISFEKLVDLLK